MSPTPGVIRQLDEILTPTYYEFRNLRLTLGLKQQLAVLTGYKRRTVWAIEHGDREVPRARNVMWGYMQDRLSERSRA